MPQSDVTSVQFQPLNEYLVRFGAMAVIPKSLYPLASPELTISLWENTNDFCPAGLNMMPTRLANPGKSRNRARMAGSVPPESDE